MANRVASWRPMIRSLAANGGRDGGSAAMPTSAARTPGLAYAQTRLQARHGQRPSDDRWRVLEATPDLPGYLQAGRATSLRPWVLHLTGEASTHQIERSLRHDWQAYVAEIVDWVPEAWAPATSWLATLPFLPFFVHLARGEPAPRWMLDDPVLVTVAQADADRREEALATTSLGRISEPVRDGKPPVDAWLDAWVAEWPVRDVPGRRALERVRRAFHVHVSTILAEPLQYPPGPALRRRIAERFTVAFRRESGRITAVFAHLGLMALDVERLRGGLVLRALFPDPAERPQWA